MATFLERYQAGDRVAVWDDLMALGDGVRHDLYYQDARAVAAETMRRARHNVEELIRRLESMGYRFQDEVSNAEDQLSRLDFMNQLAEQMNARKPEPNAYNTHAIKMLEGIQAMKAKMAPMLEKAAQEAARKSAAKRKRPLEDPNVFSPPDKKTPKMLDKLEKAANGPLPISLRAWYEVVGGVSLIGSHTLLNDVDFGNRGGLRMGIGGMQVQLPGMQPVPPQPATTQDIAPDPLVIVPLEELLSQASEDEDGGGDLQLVIAPDDLHKANISGDAYYIHLPDAKADFVFDDGRRDSFVNYLRRVFQWGGFPGWERSGDAPRKELAELSEGLLPL